MSNFDKVLAAIEVQEGYKPGSLAFENKNPGNLKFGPFARSMGATGKDRQGHAIFPTVEKGREALSKLIRVKFNGMTLEQIGPIYAEDPKWAAGVSKISGVLLNEPIVYDRPRVATHSQGGARNQGSSGTKG